MGPEFTSLSLFVNNAGEVLPGWSSVAPQTGLSGSFPPRAHSAPCPWPPHPPSVYVRPDISIDVLIPAGLWSISTEHAHCLVWGPEGQALVGERGQQTPAWGGDRNWVRDFGGKHSDYSEGQKWAKQLPLNTGAVAVLRGEGTRRDTETQVHLASFCPTPELSAHACINLTICRGRLSFSLLVIHGEEETYNIPVKHHRNNCRLGFLVATR